MPPQNQEEILEKLLEQRLSGMEALLTHHHAPPQSRHYNRVDSALMIPDMRPVCQYLNLSSSQPSLLPEMPDTHQSSSSLPAALLQHSPPSSYPPRILNIADGQIGAGMYSTSGIDMISLLAKVVNRPTPIIHLGPVDLSSSFLVVDARKQDMPIVYASESFERLTGYSIQETMGKNCRFLQSPDGWVEKGSIRKFVDNSVVHQLKSSIENGQECQYININYKKSGEPFVNLITVVPIEWGRPGEIGYFIGFQVDLMQQSRAILRKLEDGSYVIDFNSKDAALTPISAPVAQALAVPLSIPATLLTPKLSSVATKPVEPNSKSSLSPAIIAAESTMPLIESWSALANAPQADPASLIPNLFADDTSTAFLGDSTSAASDSARNSNFHNDAFNSSSRHHGDFDDSRDASMENNSSSSANDDTIDPEHLSHFNLIQNGPDFIHILSSR
ncbi:hypothetical protein SeMB42_g07764, partial [Synchytrium endobioticum]